MKTLAFKSSEVSGWGNFPIGNSYLYRPERIRDVEAILKFHEQEKLIARGYGRSYGDAAINTEEGVILNERLDRFLEFYPESGILKCESGVQLKEILDHFVPKGYFLPVTPGTKFPSVGGSFACDVHGKNHHRDGSFSNHVTEIELLLASGEVIKCSKQNNSNIFWATAGGMGLTGIILTVTLKLQKIETAYICVDYVRTANLDETIDLCETSDENYTYSVCWIDCLASGASLGRSVLMRGEHARIDQLPKSLVSNPLLLNSKKSLTVPITFPNFVINPISVKVFNTVYYFLHSKKRFGAIVDYDSYFYPLDFVLEWNKIYGRRGFLQYQCVFPLDRSRKALAKVLKILSDSKIASFLAVLKRFGRQDGLLSFPMFGYTIALDIPISGNGLFEVLNQLDKIVVSEGGRIYLGKDARMTSKSFELMYANLEDWRNIKSSIDPENIFSSDLSRRLNLML